MKKMNILVNKNCEVDLPINQIFKDIICPECKENALIDIKILKSDYMVVKIIIIQKISH